MEQTPDKKSSRTLLIVLIVAVVLIALLVGAFFTCVCTCRRCVKCAKCGIETCGEWAEQLAETPAAQATQALATAKPAATASAGSPDGQVSASELVREKRVKLKNDGTDTVTVSMHTRVNH